MERGTMRLDFWIGLLVGGIVGLAASALIRLTHAPEPTRFIGVARAVCEHPSMFRPVTRQ
jgi:hypothetical protein